MPDSRSRTRIAGVGIAAGAALLCSLTLGSVPALAAKVPTGNYHDRAGEAEGLVVFARRCGPPKNGRLPVCSRKKKVRVTGANGGLGDELQCASAGGDSSPPDFSGTYFAGSGARITRERTFRSTARNVDRFTFDNYDDFGNPDGTTWTTEETVVSRIDGRFRGRTVTGTYEFSREVRLVSGTPDGFPALGKCTTGVVSYSATLRR